MSVLGRKTRTVVDSAAANRMPGTHTEELELVKRFFAGKLAEYLATTEGKKDVLALANDPEKFSAFCRALETPGATKRMAKFLKTAAGIHSFATVGRTEEGMDVLVKLGQEPVGREVARAVLRDPILGWKAFFKMVKLIGKSKLEDRQAAFPTFDFSSFYSRPDAAEAILPMLRDRTQVSTLFTAFSGSKESVKLCCRILEIPEVRKAFLDFFASDPTATVNLFKKLLQSEERRKRICEIFVSSGGTQMLLDTIDDKKGRLIVTLLAISEEGRNMGIHVLLSNPITLVRMGWRYFREPNSEEKIK